MAHILSLLLVLSLAVVASQARSAFREEIQWQAYKQKYGKVYENETVESLRKTIFARNKHHIDSFNKRAADKSHTLALNHLADLTHDELAIMRGFKLPADEQARSEAFKNSPEGETFLQTILNDNSIEVPEVVDWRKVEGRVSPVKDQELCGSCWAFASTGVLEGQEKVRARNSSEKLIPLSEQNLVDCVKTAHGCDGGWMKDALDYVKLEGGIEDEQSYPYEAHDDKCRFKRAKSVFTDSGSVILPEGDEEKLRQVVAKFGPVSVAIDASGDGFMYYGGGVFYSDDCSNSNDRLDHAVLVVGYGTNPTQGDYWIVKNSWGTKWGDQGYIKMARNRANNCGIATVATIPIFL